MAKVAKELWGADVIVQGGWNLSKVEEEYGAAGLITSILEATSTIDSGRKGFGERSLRYMRRFYLTFPIRSALRPN